MTAKRLTSKILKITAYFLGVLLVLMTAFHFWFTYHAEGLVEDLVSFQSKNTVALKVDKFKFNWFNYRLELRNPVFYSTNLTASTSYQFRIKKMDIRVRAILPLLFEKKILIDSLHLDNPDIIVTKLRVSKDTTDPADTSVSLTQEMGRIYNSIQEALNVLDVNSFQIDNGKFSLINRINLSESPVVITNIHLHLDNLRVDSTEQDNEKKILFSDNLALHTTSQNIVFPDGRHRLSFSQFRINILKRFVEFDSCTIMATRGDSSSNSFRVFFDKLQMTNIDFTTLYHNEIIKADSVYCINPRFRLDVDLPKRKGSGISPPKLDELVRQLTGDMQLAFVVVENGSFDINTTRDGRPSSFTSDHNNFELQGLEIKKGNERALTVDKFVMAIRNYENFLRDSAYAIQFDSILIDDNRISLSNFGYKELQNNKTVNSLSMPSFELQGLSWDELIYDQQLKADKVTLYRPVINYNVAKNKRSHSGDVFQALAGIGSFMQLEQLNINRGQINLLFKNDAALLLENADMSVQANQLVNSRKLSNIQRSVNELFFDRGVFTMGDLTAVLSDVNFKGGSNNQLHAGTLAVKNKSHLDINATGVTINTLLIDDDINETVINGVSWRKADIKLASFPGQIKNNSTRFNLKEIVGVNTNLLISDSSKKLSLHLEELSADQLSTMNGSKPIVKGLKASGKDLHITNGALQLNIDDLQLADHQLSVFNNFTIKKTEAHDSVKIRISQLEFEPDINTIIDGNISTANVRIVRPDIQVHLNGKGNGESTKKNFRLPQTSIKSLVIEQPVLQLSNYGAKGPVTLNWDGSDNKMELHDLQIAHNSPTRISTKKVLLSLHNFLYTGAGGKKFYAKDGKLNVQLDDVEMQQTETNDWDWKGVVTRLEAKNFILDSLGKNCATLTLSTARLNDFAIVSTSLLNMRELITSNAKFRLAEMTGSYNDGKNNFSWYNTNYDKYTRLLSADSFSYHPVRDQQTFIKESPWQTDYITAKTGAISFGPFDIEKYVRDSIIDMGVLDVDNARLTVFRDKRVPRKPGIVRPLPSDQLKKIPMRLQVDTARINNSYVEYEEFNEKTNDAGKITVANLNGRITRVRNHNLQLSDSLHLVANAFIEDSIFTRLNVKQSYTDSLGGFLMTVQMGPADLAVLNPVLKALASAELKSGRLDTLSMRVVGREELAFGEIKMSYHGLKVLILKKGGGTKPLLSGVKNFFANTLIKNESNEKGSRIFIRRQKDRSAINYLVKITFNGITNTITGKKSKKAYRKNKAEIAEKPLPPAGM